MRAETRVRGRGGLTGNTTDDPEPDKHARDATVRPGAAASQLEDISRVPAAATERRAGVAHATAAARAVAPEPNMGAEVSPLTRHVRVLAHALRIGTQVRR